MSINTKYTYLALLQLSGVNFFLQNEPNNDIYLKTTNKDRNIEIKNIKDAKSLNQLLSFVNKSSYCLLKQKAKNTIFSQGNPESKIMIINDVPNDEEDNVGKSFIGLKGELLDKMLLSINLNRKNVYITNIIPWCTPKNRIPSSEEIFQCMPFVQRHIEIVKPTIIILLGEISAKNILSSQLDLDKIRGKWHQYQSINLINSISVIETYNPSHLLKSINDKKKAWEDLKNIKKFIVVNEII